MSQNTEKTINYKIELSTLNENNNIISEENNSLNIINKGYNDHFKLSNNIKEKKVNLMKRIEYIDIIETIAIFFVVYIHNNTIIGTTSMANITLQFSSIISVPLFYMCNGTLLFSRKLNIKRLYKKSLMVFISIALWKIIYALLSIGPKFFKIEKKEIFYYIIANNFLKGTYVPAGHFWFTNKFIALHTIFPIIKIIYDNYNFMMKYIYLYLFFFSFIHTEINVWLSYFCIKYKFNCFNINPLNDYNIVGSCHLFFYFLIGIVFHNRFYNKKNSLKTKILLFISFIFSFIFLIFCKYVQLGGTLKGEWARLNNDYRRLSTVLVCSTFYCFICSIDFSNWNLLNKICSFISIRTMNIYIIHFFVGMRYGKYENKEKKSILRHIIKVFITILISFLLTEPITFIPYLNFILNLYPQRKIKCKKLFYLS